MKKFLIFFFCGICESLKQPVCEFCQKIVVCGDNPHHLLVHQAVDEHAEESKVVEQRLSEHAQEEKLEFPSDSGSRVEEADELKGKN
jgi:hypothetical protein